MYAIQQYYKVMLLGVGWGVVLLHHDGIMFTILHNNPPPPLWISLITHYYILYIRIYLFTPSTAEFPFSIFLPSYAHTASHGSSP